MRMVPRSGKLILLPVENVRRSEDRKDRSLESRSLGFVYLFGDCVVPMCI